MLVNKDSCTRELALSRVKKSPFISLMIISSIVLTLTLFITIFSMFLGFLKVTQLELLYTGGSDYHGVFHCDEDALRNHPLIKEYSMVYHMYNPLPTKDIEYCDLMITDKGFGDHMMADIIGAWPSKPNEILLSKKLVEKLGLSGNLLETFTLSIYEKEYVFTLTGIIHTKELSSVYNAYDNIGILSEDWKDTSTSHLYAEMYVMLRNPFLIQSSMKQIMKETGIVATYDINEAYIVSNIVSDLTSIGVISFLLIIVLISGSLLIYNIFYISLLQDIRFCGLLRTIGLTKKQLKKMITIQGNILYWLACPLGILFGYFLGYRLLTPAFLTLSKIKDVNFSFLPIILFSCVFTYITLLLSIYKPKQLISKMTLIESTKYIGVTKKNNKKGFQSTNLILELCVNSLLQRKKILVITTLSLVSGLTLLGIIYQATTSIDPDIYGSKKIAGDYVISSFEKTAITPTISTEHVVNSENYNMEDYIEEQNTLLKSLDSDEKRKESNYVDIETYTLLNEITGIHKIEKVYTNYITLFESNTFNNIEVHGIGPMAIDYIRRNEDNYVEGRFDYNQFMSGDYVIITQLLGHTSPFLIGDIISIKGKEYKVMAILGTWFSMGESIISNLADFKVFLPQEEYLSAIDTTDKFTRLILLTDEQFQIESVASLGPNTLVSSREAHIARISKLVLTLRLIGYGLSMILVLIGILNLINTYFTTIHSRKLEFSILESVGMTKIQQIKMFFVDGFLYFVIIGGSFLTIGRLSILYLIKYTRNTLDFLSDTEDTSFYIYIILSLLILISMIIYISYKTMFRKTVAMRIRE